MPQPNFVPVRPSVSRSTQSSGVSALSETERDLPLTVKVIGGIGRAPREKCVPKTVGVAGKGEGGRVLSSAPCRTLPPSPFPVPGPDHLRTTRRSLLRHDGGDRRHHRRGYLPHARGRRGASGVAAPGARGLGGGWRDRPGRRLLLRRAGTAPPERRWRLRVPARDVGTAPGLPVRVGAVAGDRHGRHRGRGGVVGVVVALGAALVPILFTYGGWQQTNFIAEEIIEPERNLPRALVLGVAGVVIVYLLANVAYLRVLGLGGLARSTAPAADVMRALLGPAGGTLIAAGITASTFGFLNLVILVTPRVLQAMAADGVFLPRLAVLHPRFRTPALAILVQAGWATVLTLSGTFAQLVDYVAFGDWIFFGLTVAGLFIYRARDRITGAGPVPPLPVDKAFRVPGYPWTPGLFVLAALYVVASAILANPRNALIGAGLLALGVPVYLLSARSSGRGVV